MNIGVLEKLKGKEIKIALAAQSPHEFETFKIVDVFESHIVLETNERKKRYVPMNQIGWIEEI
jgi:hypothetical protein